MQHDVSGERSVRPYVAAALAVAVVSIIKVQSTYLCCRYAQLVNKRLDPGLASGAHQSLLPDPHAQAA